MHRTDGDAPEAWSVRLKGLEPFDVRPDDGGNGRTSPMLAKRPEERYPDAAAMLAAMGPMAPQAPTGDQHATVGFLLRRMQRK